MKVWVRTLLLLTTVYNVSSTKLSASIYDFTYIINQKRLCESGKSVDILIWVHSAPGNIRRRIALRETWSNEKNMPRNIGTKLVFFLGNLGSNKTIQDRLYFESEMYADLVQENYRDSYKNLTYKAMSGLKWINKYCRNARLILKSDDDMIIDMHRLVGYLTHLVEFPKPLNNTIICDIFKNKKAIREKSSKWYVKKWEYDNATYPPYCPGLALLLTPDLVPRLLSKANSTEYFWVDDVFFTGILTEHMNIRWQNIGNLFSFGKIELQHLAVYSGSVLFWHTSKPAYSINRYYYLWRAISHTNYRTTN